MIVTKYIGSYEVCAGARVPYPSIQERLSFSFITVCDAVEPEVWHGEVMFAGSVLLATGPVNSRDKAGRDAETAFLERVRAVLAGTGSGAEQQKPQ